jgi:hypothetical protein
LPDAVAGATGDRPAILTLDDRQEGPEDGGIGHVAVLARRKVAERRRVIGVLPLARLAAWLVDVLSPSASGVQEA